LRGLARRRPTGLEWRVRGKDALACVGLKVLSRSTHANARTHSERKKRAGTSREVCLFSSRTNVPSVFENTDAHSPSNIFVVPAGLEGTASSLLCNHRSSYNGTSTGGTHALPLIACTRLFPSARPPRARSLRARRRLDGGKDHTARLPAGPTQSSVAKSDDRNHAQSTNMLQQDQGRSRIICTQICTISSTGRSWPLRSWPYSMRATRASS